MNTPLLALQVPAPIPDMVKKRRVLLIDTSHAKRNLRAEVLRKFGMDVDCAADIAEARVWWRPALYDVVLINMGKGRGQRDKFCDDLRSATPPQRWPFWLDSQNIFRIYPTRIRTRRWRAGTKRLASVVRKVSFLPIREIRLSAGAFWKLLGEFPQSAPRPSRVPKRCAHFLLRLEILKGDHKSQQQGRPA